MSLRLSSWVALAPPLDLRSSLKSGGDIFLALQYVFLPHPSPKYFPVLIYLAKKVCGERHRTGNGCHSSLSATFVFLRLSPEQLTVSVHGGLVLIKVRG